MVSHRLRPTRHAKIQAVQTADPTIRREIERVYAAESRRVLATLIRLLGDFDRAEEALSDAFVAALEQWPRDGIPANPRAWLVSAGRFKAIDTIRRRARFDRSLKAIAESLDDDAALGASLTDAEDETSVQDDQLRLIFTCCHPALAEDSRVALTLREVCGLTTEAIASAFLTAVPTMAQRIVRAKAKIRDAGIPYQVPQAAELADRLDAVLRVVYLVFNEGYFASRGASLVRVDLSAEAIRLGRLLADLQPDAETFGLLALMLLTEARRPARTNAAGDVVLLEDQDRALWDRALIAEGRSLYRQALATRDIGAYTLQAGIADAHAAAADAAETEWSRIVGLYDLLLESSPSPVVELNRAAAIAMRDGPGEGLALVDEILERGDLGGYSLAFAARADLCRRLGRFEDARRAYRRALDLTDQDAERRFLARRLSDLGVMSGEG
jgi:RNA polymerase sigma-70 factor (ECF subfamily)